MKYYTIIMLAIMFLTGCNGTPMDLEKPQINRVVVIAIDTLRADHLGCYGYDRGTSPNIDLLASRGITYTNAYTPQSLTTSSFAAFFTGLHPAVSGVKELYQEIPADIRSLTWNFKDAGWKTYGVASTGVMKGELGFNRGFDRYISPERGTVDRIDITNLASQMMDDIGSDNAFLFIHMWDTHLPYEPEPEDIIPPLENLRYFATYDNMHQIADNTLEISYRDVGNFISLYDAEIRGIDQSVGDTLFDLQYNGWLDDTLIVLMSDHGEALGEYRRFSHGEATPWELRIPLIFCYPNGYRAGEIDDTPIEITDILPTVLADCWLECSKSLSGHQIGNRTPDGYFVACQGVRALYVHHGRGEHPVQVNAVENIENIILPTDITDEQVEQLRALGYVY